MQFCHSCHKDKQQGFEPLNVQIMKFKPLFLKATGVIANHSLGQPLEEASIYSFPNRFHNCLIIKSRILMSQNPDFHTWFKERSEIYIMLAIIGFSDSGRQHGGVNQTRICWCGLWAYTYIDLGGTVRLSAEVFRSAPHTSSGRKGNTKVFYIWVLRFCKKSKQSSFKKLQEGYTLY